MNGPHLVIDHQTDPWPGLNLRVFKDGYQMGCCLSLDSRRRTVRQLGLPSFICNIPDEEYEQRVQTVFDYPEATEVITPIGFGRLRPLEGLRYLVDGKLFNPYDHIREVSYDAVLVYGHIDVIKRYHDQFPKHFVPCPHYHDDTWHKLPT